MKASPVFSFLRLAASVFCLLFAAEIFAQNAATAIVGWDFQANKSALETAPLQSSGAPGIAFSIPMPDGVFHETEAFESPIFTAEAAGQFPELRSYLVQGMGIFGRINITPEGFFGFVQTATQGFVFIEPDGSGQLNRYRVFRAERSPADGFECKTIEGQDITHDDEANRRSAQTTGNGATLRTYDFAIVCTDEFEAANANPTTTATNTVAALNVIYESEVAVHLNIMGIALENGTYNINTAGGANADEAINAVSAYFPNSATYDLGHVFNSLGGSGVAYLGVVCDNGAGNAGGVPIKAGGWSSSTNNTSVGWVALVAHEIGHQFNATHTFNGTASSCSGNITPATSYEPGSGTTLMSYSQSCGTDNILNSSGSSDTDDYHFHSNSLERIIAYIASGDGNCSTNSASGNAVPVANANPGGQSSITIPKQTPFTLIGSATDANASDVLTYSWEQYNPGPPHGAPDVAVNSTTGPIARVYSPGSSPARTFPALPFILNNANVPPAAGYGDFLPGVARTLNFNFQVRDNHAGAGGVHCSPLTVTVSSNGPLAVSAPNTAVSWAAGSSQTVTWDVNGTNGISTCANVNILLSINGGQSFPYVLLTNTANDGSQSVTIPATLPATTQARIRVECNTGNVYIVPFDVSNVNFTITNPSCAAAASAICPDAAVSAASGSSSLNFSFENYVPIAVASKTFAVSGSDPLMTRARWNNGVTACMSPGGTTNYQTYRFVVSQTGTYTFTFGSGNFRAVHLYANAFDPNDPCTNFVASSVRDGAGYYSGIITSTGGSSSVSLTTCTEYVLVVTTEGFGGNTTVTFGGAGSIYEVFASPGGYAYTYIAVNQANSQVAAVSASASFSSLTAGTYCVFGLSYLSSLDPNTFVGQTLAVVLSNCVQLSSNCKPVVVTGGGCTPPTISSQPASLTRCVGQSATFSVTASGGTLTYQWKKGGSDISGATNSTYTIASVTASDAATYTVVVSNAPNCSTTSNGAVLTVNTLPNVSISGNLSICAGGNTTLVASGGMTYLWNTGASTAAITVSPGATTTYTVTATNANGCTATQTATVTVNSNPTASISGNLSICVGAGTTLTASGGTSYLWSNGETTAAINVSPSATTTYTVTVSNASGCSDTESATVNVSPAPTAAISGNLSICAGTATTLTASGGTSYLWSTGAATAAISVSPATTTTYTVTVSNGAGCTDTETATVSVNANTIIIKFTPTKPTCFGLSNGKLKATGSGSVSPYTYLWNTGSTAQQLTNIPAGTYTVTVSSAGGCTLSASYTLTQPAVVAVNGTVTQITCNNLNNGQIVASATGGSGAKTYLWNTGATTATISALAAGTYSVTATDTKGCTGTNSFTIINPTAVSLSVVSIVAATGGKWKVNLQATGGTPFSATILHKYNYRPAGSATWTLATWTGNKAFTLLPGTYDFGARDKNSCEAIVASVSVPPTASAAGPVFEKISDEIGSPSVLKIAPNPTNGALNLSMENLPAGAVSVEIFDLTGRKIRAASLLSDGATSMAEQFDLSPLASGAYLVRVVAGDFAETVRVVKE